MPDEQATQEATQQEQKPAAPSAETKNTDTQSQEQTVPYARFKEINDKLKALEDDAAKKAKADADEEERRKIAQGEWQKLAEENKAKVAELTPKADLAAEMLDWFNGYVKAETAEWPESLKAFDPGDEAAFKVRTKWLDEGRKLAAQLAEGKAPAPGNGRRPTPSAPAGTGARDKESRAQQGSWTRTQF